MPETLGAEDKNGLTLPRVSYIRRICTSAESPRLFLCGYSLPFVMVALPSLHMTGSQKMRGKGASPPRPHASQLIVYKKKKKKVERGTPVNPRM